MRRNPGKLNYSTSGAGTILNLGPQMMFDVLKLGPEAAVQVAYKGGGDAAMAVLSREVDFNCGNLTSLIGNLKGGRMRALFTTTPQRWQDIPDVPTVRELGYPQLEAIIGWSALYGPPGMPAEQIAFWREALAKVADGPAMDRRHRAHRRHAQRDDAGRHPPLRRRPVRAVRPDRQAARHRDQVGPRRSDRTPTQRELRP